MIGVRMVVATFLAVVGAKPPDRHSIDRSVHCMRFQVASFGWIWGRHGRFTESVKVLSFLLSLAALVIIERMSLS